MFGKKDSQSQWLENPARRPSAYEMQSPKDTKRAAGCGALGHQLSVAIVPTFNLTSVSLIVRERFSGQGLLKSLRLLYASAT